MEAIRGFVEKYLIGLSMPELTITDVVEMLIIAFCIYQIIMWVKNTRAWMLVKGIIILLVFSMLAIFLPEPAYSVCQPKSYRSNMYVNLSSSQ